jgi:hypothetical protein
MMARRAKKKTPFPRGWDEARVRKVLSHYEGQTDKQAAREDEAAFKGASQTIMKVPRRLVPAVRALIAAARRD